MRENRLFLLWLAACLGSCVCLSAIISTWLALKVDSAAVERLSAENERLRAFNARRTRRLKWIERPESIDLEIVALPEHLLGTPASVVAALIYCENGPQDIETGSIDKTDFWAKNLPLKYWSTLDGARTLNRMAWEWLQQNPTQFKEFLVYAARPYTAMNRPLQAAWAANMVSANERFKAGIGKDPSPPVVVPNFTPTPNYGYNLVSKTKAQAPAKKAPTVRRKKR